MDDLSTQEKERDLHVATVVSTLKSLADATEGRSLDRVGAKLLVAGVKALKEPGEKEASRPREAVALAVMAERLGGESWVGFETATLHEMGFDEAEVVKILAAKVALYTPDGFLDWGVFHRLACVFNDVPNPEDLMHDLTVAELAWAADCMRYLDPATPWNDEVAAYVAAVAFDEGFVAMPKTLSFAAPQLARLTRSRVATGDAERVQAERIAAVGSYVNGRHERLSAELKKV